MIFEIPFDKNLYQTQLLLHFNLTWKRNKENNRMRLIWGIPMVLIGYYMITSENYFGYLLIGFGIHSITNFIDNYIHYRKNKKQYFDLIETEIDNQKKSQENSIWEFNEESFCYKDYRYETKMIWSSFKSYRVIESNLFLDINIGPSLSYVLAESEIGKEEFEKVTEFIKTKIG
jgi:hypothetical protein